MDKKILEKIQKVIGTGEQSLSELLKKINESNLSEDLKQIARDYIYSKINK